MNTNSLGIYRRGRTFWLSWTVGKKRYRESLKTTDEAQAMQRAIEWKQHPGLLLSRQIDREIADYIADRLAKGKLRPVTATARRCALVAFRKAAGCTVVHELTTAVIRAWYEAAEARRCLVHRGSAFENGARFLPLACGGGSLAIEPGRIDPSGDLLHPRPYGIL